MRYWWVNQNQTFRHEFEGGYLWSPKRNANGARNPFYETMREVSPGDLILSFVDTRIAAIGVAGSYCYESPKPLSTEREALIIARRGQGLFRQGVAKIERMCRITRVDNPVHLRASHAKPWRDCLNNDERLDGENGLLLTPSIDHLFDRGFITFEDSGALVISPVAPLRHSSGWVCQFKSR